MKAVFALLLLAGCISASGSIDPEIAQNIPEGANVIKLTSTQKPEDLYRSIYLHVTDEGYKIAESDNEMMTFTTDYKDIGQETTLAVIVSVNYNKTGSQATLRGQWGISGSFTAGIDPNSGIGAGQNVGERARWTQSREGVAFGRLAVIANDIAHEELTYSVE